MPAIFHMVLYRGILLDRILWNASTLGLLLSIPTLVIIAQIGKGSLWWTGFQEIALSRLKTISMFVAVIVFVGSFEHRILFSSFSQWIPLFPPWNYILITIVLYILTALFGFHLMGYLGELGRKRVIPMLLLVALCGSLAFGIPWYWIPASLIGAVAFGEFYFSRKLKYYMVFVVCSTIIGALFIMKYFWFLEYRFVFLSLSLQEVCLILLLMFLLSSLVPGIVLSNYSISLNGIVLGVHALLLALVEQTLYEQKEEEFYPPFFIVATSAAGISLLFKLEKEGKLLPNATWLLFCFYLSKLSLLLPPMPLPILSSMLFSITVTPLWFFNSGPPKMTIKQGLVYTLSIAVVALVTRHSFPSSLFQLLFQQDKIPSESVLFAWIMILLSVACLPLSFRYFSHLSSVRSLNLFVLLSGVFYILFQPEIMTPSGATPLTSYYELSPRWPFLSLYISILSTVSCLFSIVPFRRSANVRYFYCAAMGICLGLFLCGTYIPMPTQSKRIGMMGIVYGLFSLMLTLLTGLVVFTGWPTLSSGKLMRPFFALFESLLPITYLFIPLVFEKFPITSRREEMIQSTRTILVSLYAASNILLAFLMKSNLAYQEERSRPKKSKVIASDWMPYIGNMSAILGFLLSVWLNLLFLGGSRTSIFILAPVLLLLNHDERYFKGLTEKNRYYPIIFAISTFLVSFALKDLFLGYVYIHWSFANFGVSFTVGDIWDLVSFLRNMILFLFTLPTQYFFGRFMWNFARQREYLWLMIVPLNFLSLFFSNILSIQMLAVVGIVFGVLEMFVNHQIQKAGRSVL